MLQNRPALVFFSAAMSKSFPPVAVSDTAGQMCPLQNPAQPTPMPQVVRNPALRALLRVMAALCLVLAVLGVVVPGLPTTVFVLLAAWAAARSSVRLHAWLWQHRLFGPMLQNWAAGGCVSRRAKWSATVMMVLCGAALWFLPHTAHWVATFACVSMACVLLWLWQRPEPKK